MSLIKNALFVWKSEGLVGIFTRINSRYSRMKIWIAFLVGKSDLRSDYGPRFMMNYGDATFQCYISSWYGKFYWRHLSSIDRPFVFVDVGANQGLYSICASQNTANVATFAFEPVPQTFEFLRQNVELNGVQDKCVLVNKALSSESAFREISIASGHSGAASLAEPNAEQVAGITTMRIETIDGSAFAEMLEGQEAPLVFKVDVEGFEWVVLQEILQSAIAPRIEEIFYEVHEGWVNPAELRQLLVRAGFTSFKKFGAGQRYDILASRVC
jgi:FkbM family methyltransferase